MKTALMMAVIFIALRSEPSSAGTQTGVITNLNTRVSDGLVWFDMSGPWDNKPSCSHFWVLPGESTESGKKLYAVLLAARASGRTIKVSGRNACSRWPDGEDVETVGF